jgi:hypothetical protein
MKTTIEKAIEDIKGYRTFDDKIDVRFVCVLLESYLKNEEEIIKCAFLDGEQNGVTLKLKDIPKYLHAADYFEKKFKDKK